MQAILSNPFSPDEYVTIPSEMSVSMSNKGLTVKMHNSIDSTYKKVVMSYSNGKMRIFFYLIEDYINFNNRYDIKPGEFEGA